MCLIMQLHKYFNILNCPNKYTKTIPFVQFNKNATENMLIFLTEIKSVTK